MLSHTTLISNIIISIQLTNKPWSKIYNTINSTEVHKQCYKMVYVNPAVRRAWENNKPLKKTTIISTADL